MLQRIILGILLISSAVSFANGTQLSDTKIKYFHAKDFGILPDSKEDIAPLFNKLITEASKYPNVKIEFQKGKYHIWPDQSLKRTYYISNTSSEVELPSKEKTIALLFENFEKIEVEGNGALFMLHGKMINFAFVNCQSAKIQNASFDYQRPTMSELEFLSVKDDEIIVKINPSSTYSIINDKIQFYDEKWIMERNVSIAIDPELSTWYYSDFKPLKNANASEIEPFKVRFTGDFSKVKYTEGQVLTIRDPFRDQVGAFIGYSKNISLKNVQMHYMHGMGIVSQFSENITFDTVYVEPRNETGRKIAAFADCFHFSGCKGTITIKNCKTSGAHDDAVNVHGTHLKVVKKISAKKIHVKFLHHQTYGMKAFFKGDSIEFVRSKSLEIYNSGIVENAKKINDRLIELTLKNSIPSEFTIGDVVENVTWTPSVIIQNNYFSGTNTRGILLTTRKPSIIENNTFYRTGMHAILIANDASSWYESGPTWDLTIKGNKFIECGYNQIPNNYIINIWPENHEIVKGYYVHKNIRIEENEFVTFDNRILQAKGTNGLIFKNNTMKVSDNFGYKKERDYSFNLFQCRQVELSFNKTDKGKFDGFQLKAMDKNEIDISAN